MKQQFLSKFADMLQEKVNNYFMENYKESFLKGCHRTEVVVKEGKKYHKINIGDSGKFMYDTANDNIYYIKGYGVIDRAKCFGEIEAIVGANFDYDGHSIVPFKRGKMSAYGFAGAIA